MFNQTTRNVHRFCILDKHLVSLEAVQLNKSYSKTVNVLFEYRGPFV